MIARRGASVKTDIYTGMESRAGAEAVFSETGFQQSRRLVLIVDDEELIGAMARRALRSAGYDVKLASDGFEGMEFFARDRFDVALLDIKTPKMDGLEMTRRMIAADETISVIAMSAFSTFEMAVEALRAGAFDMCAKPLEIDSLLERVDRAARRTRSARLAARSAIELERELESRSSALRRRYERASEFFLETIRALVSAIEIKDPYTRGHSMRVAEFSRRIARRMGMRDVSIERIYFAAALHDIGKIGAPEAILLKQGRLTEDEYATMKLHPEKSAEILAQVDEMSDVALIARHHHERWDGSGYPMGLRGDEIPFASRIVAVADTFDAMTSTRSYRKGLSIGQAKDELMKMSGSQFDPDVIEAFAAIADRGELYLLEL